ncbi:MAG TPA: M23 family metallopeptidase [bacterium]|nr:M23 family metallopeptidase [bacterium]
MSSVSPSVSRAVSDPTERTEKAMRPHSVPRSWLRVLVLGLLLLPAFSVSELPNRPFVTNSVGFLDAVAVQTRAVQTLVSSVMIPSASVIPSLPAAADPKGFSVPAAARPRFLGTSASLVSRSNGVKGEPFVVVTDGQTLWGIAQSHGIAAEDLAAANALGVKALLAVGQQLIIPPKALGAERGLLRSAAHALSLIGAPRQVTVRVREGETLWEIAQATGLPVDAIVNANEIPDSASVHTGQRLTIPGGALDMLRRVTAARGIVSIAQNFVWPVRGQLTSRFGWRLTGHHNGIDIAAPRGSSISVAKEGRVLFAGWYFGYGLAVVVDHGSGISTVYGHASKLLVQIGEVVEAGQVIALVGSTGDATGPHLHFEIRTNGIPLNPMKYL